MPNLFLETSVDINAPADAVWKLIAQPDWEVDDEIEGKGKIMKLEHGKLLKHNVLRLSEGISMMSSIVTYELQQHGAVTTLKARESFAETQSDKAFADARARWEALLQHLKTEAEHKTPSPYSA